MPHVLVAGRIHEAGIGVLRAAAGVTFEVVEEASTKAYAPRILAADALDAGRIAGAGLDVFAGRLDPALAVNRDAIAFGPPGARAS